MADDTDQAPDDEATAAADETVSVAPFIDDDDDDEAAADASAVSDDDEVDDEVEVKDPEAPAAKGAKGAMAKAIKGATAKGATARAIKGDDDAPTEPVVTRRTVTSKRVTPKGGGAQKPSGPKKAGGQENDIESSTRYTPPGTGAYAQGPSPWWVPTLLFGFLIIGALIIMLNYVQAFGEPSNIYLVVGLVFILGGIITATQYR